jgi:Asp-tRNA(Asn)/Glu-tRNA(Gln) amidotransferase A subunit family amidase
MSEVNQLPVSRSQATDLCYITATEAIERFKSGTLSPVELMEAVIQRSEEVNPKVNAYTYTFFDRALDQAREAEAKYARGEAVRPLEGISCAIKDLHPVAGEITTWGSKVFEGVRSEFTVPTVQRLLDAGAIMHARTTTPEFGHNPHTQSPLWGISRNPWNTDYSPGGSSGGAGASVAAGMSTIADGTDGGGSIRIPASACGVFGYKPSFGRNPCGWLDTNLEMFLHFGPVTRSVADAALMQNVMSGPHVSDITTLRPKLEFPALLDQIKGWKVAFSPNLGYFEVDPEVAANTAAAADAFRELGCEVREVEVGWNSGVLDAWTTHWEGLCASLLGHVLPRWQYELDPFVRGLLQRGMSHSAVRMKQTEFVRTEMYKSLGPILEDYDVLVCPTLAVPSVSADHQADDPDFKINGARVDPYIAWCMTYPFNLVSQCPVATVPTGFASTGVPTGMQIIGKTFDDMSVMRAAASFESIRPWASAAPAI